MPKGKEENQFINIDDVLSAISLRQYQFKDKHLTVLLLTHDGDKVARLKNGKVITAYSEKVDKKVVADRLAEWKRQMNKSRKQLSLLKKTSRQEQVLQILAVDKR